jgi:hypothetical protein
MSRRLALFLLATFFGLSLVACTAPKLAVSLHNVIPSITTTASPDPSPFVEDSPTPTPHKRAAHTPIPILTQAAYLDQLAISRARSLTPPTPTASSTFDINSIQTSTPAAPAKCPQIPLPKPIPTFEYNGQDRIGVEESVYLDYLNQFGANAFLLADQSTRDGEGQLDPHIILHRDLTNDGVPEIVVSRGQFFIFGCRNGQYQALLAVDQNGHSMSRQIVAITDLNRNGIPELLITFDMGTHGEVSYGLIEWNNGKFNDLMIPDYSIDGGEYDGFLILYGGSINFQDVDHDGLKEIVINSGSWLGAPDIICDTAPLRKSKGYYKWNGQSFVFYKLIFEPPQYRFQAVEDADHDVLDREYDQALALYQRVIFDNRLEWWTNARKDYIYSCNDYSNPPSTTPPSPDPNEYQYQAAYARFRIMVLHLMHGYQSDAQVVYQTLLKKFPDGTPGSVYADMAQAFWGEYQTSHSLVQACGKSQDVASHRLDEATRYLLDNYGYDGTVNYTLQQLCPF